jgi:hypothetical protein
MGPWQKIQSTFARPIRRQRKRRLPHPRANGPTLRVAGSRSVRRSFGLEWQALMAPRQVKRLLVGPIYSRARLSSNPEYAAEQGCARGYWPRLAPVHLRAFDRSVAEGRVKTFGSVSKLPKDLWARLDVVEWQHGVARDSEGMVYYSLHADGPRRHPNDRKALRPFGAKLCCAGDPSEFPTARSIRDSSNRSDSR